VEPVHFSSAEESGAEAVLSFPPEVAWKAITDGEDLVHWFAVTGGWPPAPAPGERYWIRSTSLGYMAFEYVAVDPPRRVVTRGLYTGRIFIWELAAVEGGTRLRITVRRGLDDRKWDADLEDNSAGYAALFVDLRRYLEGHYDAQRFPFFGIRSRPGSSGTNNAPVVTHVRPWAEAAGIRVGDQILAVDGDPVPPSPLSFAPLYPLVHRYVAGDRVTLRLKREEKTLDASLRLLDWREAADATGADVGPPPGFENN